jgi:hypothetical protein
LASLSILVKFQKRREIRKEKRRAMEGGRGRRESEVQEGESVSLTKSHIFS